MSARSNIIVEEAAQPGSQQSYEVEKTLPGGSSYLKVENDKDSDAALVVVHPDFQYDHGVAREAILSVVENFEGDVYAIPPEDTEGFYGGDHLYDHVLEEEFYGSIDEETAEFLAEEYEELAAIGGYLPECLTNFVDSMPDDAEISVIPSATYDQSFSNPEGFLVSEVLETSDPQVIKNYLDGLRDGDVADALFDSPAEEVIDDLKSLDEMTVEEAASADIETEVGFSASADGPSKLRAGV